MDEKTVNVRLPETLGVKACGKYKAGEIYEVDAREADRLIKVKRFERVSKSTAADKEA